MKTTQYFKSMRERPDRKMIQDEWIKRVMAAPVAQMVQQDGRIRKWGFIPEMNNRALLRPVIPRGGEMKIQYFEDTDTLLVVFKEAEVEVTKDLDENTLVEFDAKGNLVSMTIEHARERTDLANFSFQQVAAMRPVA